MEPDLNMLYKSDKKTGSSNKKVKIEMKMLLY